MKVGDLVKYHSPGYRYHGALAVIVGIEWDFDQVSEPQAIADILIGGEVWRGVPALETSGVSLTQRYEGSGIVLLQDGETV